MVNELFKKLTIIKSTYCYEWSLVQTIVKVINTNDNLVSIVEAEWNDSFKREYKDMYPLDLSKIETWSTYQDCVNFKFFIENKNLCCVVKIYEGDMSYGQMTSLRFTAKLLFNDSTFIRNIECSIDNDFDSYCNESYDRYLNEKRLKWVNEFKQKSLKSPKINRLKKVVKDE